MKNGYAVIILNPAGGSASMQVFEIRFSSKSGDYDKSFFSTLDELELQLVRNGSILEGSVHCYIQEETLVWRFIAQDENAIDERSMNYFSRDALGKVIKRCKALPQVIPMENCAHLPHCKCKKPALIALQAVAEWQGSPLMCLECRASIPLYRLTYGVIDRTFDDLLHWRKLYRGYMEQFLQGFNAAYSYDMLKSCVSDLTLHGRRLAGHIEMLTGALTVYPLFSKFERLPENCPQCGASWVNEYDNAIPFERFCRRCRLVM